MCTVGFVDGEELRNTGHRDPTTSPQAHLINMFFIDRANSNRIFDGNVVSSVRRNCPSLD